MTSWVLELTYLSNQAFFPTRPKSYDKDLRTKRAFKIKQKAFFVIFKGLSMKQIIRIFLECESLNLNDHTGKLLNGYEGIHSGYGYGLRNKQGKHILKFPVVHNLNVVSPRKTTKKDHLSVRWY